jgi:hypothetical protein
MAPTPNNASVSKSGRFAVGAASAMDLIQIYKNHSDPSTLRIREVHLTSIYILPNIYDNGLKD